MQPDDPGDFKRSSEFYDKLNRAKAAAAERLLAARKLDPETAARLRAARELIAKHEAETQELWAASEAWFEANLHLVAVKAPGAKEAALKTAAQLKKDPRPEIASVGASAVIALRLAGSEPQDRAALVKETLQEAKAADLSPESVDSLRYLAERLSLYDDDAQIEATLSGLAGLLEAADRRGEATQIRGELRFRKLVGRPIEIKGETLDGKPFDVADWKGKVVLVDFWATWCGPCRQEIPTVKRYYEAYHDKGFEVVGISLDADRESLEGVVKSSEIPWPNIHDRPDESDDAAAADGRERPSLASYYGINSIPTCILIGKDGRVISTEARGFVLEQHLADQFGALPESDVKTDE